MKPELTTTATPLAWSWPAQFATVWFNRRTDETDADRGHARTHPDATSRRRGLRRSGSAARGHDDWYKVDLFPTATGRNGSRFDDTVAFPIDTPQRLDAAVRAADLRLRALPEAEDLGRSAVAYQTRLQQVRYDAEEARARLATGSYGTCLTCGDPISFALLTERPWRRSCVYCDLDI
jgi:hypothetical protein